MDFQIQAAFNTGFSRQIRHPLERFDEFRPAVWVPAVVQCVHADEDVAGAEHLGQAKANDRKIVFRAGT